MTQRRSLVVERYVSLGCFYHVATRSVLLHLRSGDAEVNPGMWATFGGRSEDVDLGNLEATWRREVEEELGVVLGESQVRRLEGFAPYPGPPLPRHVFVAPWPILQADFVLTEGERLAWFRLDDALRLENLSEFDRAVLTHVDTLPGFWSPEG